MITFAVQVSPPSESLGTDALVRAGHVNAFSVYPAGSGATALVDIEALLLAAARVTLGAQAREAPVSVDAESRPGTGARLALIHI